MAEREEVRKPEHETSARSRQPDTTTPDSAQQAPAAPIAQLQQRVGNRAVQRLIARAQQGPTPATVAPDIAQAIQAARGGGQPLEAALRAQFEPRFGADFGPVRVHTDATADTLSRAVQAHAFTTGADLFFRQGAYQPGSPSGRALLAHELTHVVQQQGAPAQAPTAVSQPGDRAEQEAEQISRAVMQHEHAGAAGAIGAAGPTTHTAASGVQRQIAPLIMRQVAVEEPQPWIRAEDWKPIDPEGAIVASRVYSVAELAAIAKCNTLQEVVTQIPDVELPAGMLGKEFVRQKRPKDNGVIFRADIPDTSQFEQLYFQGNGLLRYEIFGYEKVEIPSRRRPKKGQPAPAPQTVIRVDPQPQTQMFFEKNGRQTDLPPMVTGKGSKRKETPSELTIKRKNLVGKFTAEEQERTVEEVRTEQSEVISGKTVADVWELSNPNDFFQRLTFQFGAAKQLREAYREVVRAFRQREFTPMGQLTPFQQKQFDNVRVWISGQIGKADGWAREGKRVRAEDLMAREAVPAMCNVISYYLYGQLIGKIPREKTFGEHVVEEMRRGNISSQITETDDPNARTADNVKEIVEVGGAFYGFGSGNWQERFGAQVLRAKVPITHPSRRKEFETFLNSGVRLAISHQDVKGNGAPGHFHLIIKDKNGVWRNIDHTSVSFERRGGATNFNKVYAVVFDKAALEAASEMFDQLQKQGAPVQGPLQ